MPRRHWRRFFPRRNTTPVSRQPGVNDGSIFEQAKAALNMITINSVGSLAPLINERNQIEEKNAAAWLELLILQAPRAARAQYSMDEHPHGYHNREQRLYELIDFNDTFVETVLALPENELPTFTEKLKQAIDAFCHQMNTQTFSDRQYEAITHGLSREIAVYRAAQANGFEVAMTSRTVDAFGVDMQIRSPQTGKYINVDCKTSSAFHFRLKDMVQQGRISPQNQAEAETKGYWEITNRGKGREMRIILLRINQEELGEINAFSFEDESLLVTRLQHIIAERGIG